MDLNQNLHKLLLYLGDVVEVIGIGVVRGCCGCRCTPRAEKKIWGVIYKAKLQVHPQAEQEVIFLRNFFAGRGSNWRMGVVNLAVLACVPRTTTTKKKKRILAMRQA